MPQTHKRGLFPLVKMLSDKVKVQKRKPKVLGKGPIQRDDPTENAKYPSEFGQ